MLFDGFVAVLQPENLLYLVGGVLIGVILGAIPGPVSYTPLDVYKRQLPLCYLFYDRRYFFRPDLAVFCTADR